MPRSGSPYNYTYGQQRRALLAEQRVCQLCGKEPATSADHQPPLSQHEHRPGTNLRHSHVTQLLAAGVRPDVVAKRLGHASVAFTLSTYAHVYEGDQRAALEKMLSGL